MFEQKIQDFLTNRQRNRKPVNFIPNISAANDQITRSLQLIQQLKTEQSSLHEQLPTMTNTEWQRRIAEINQERTELLSQLHTYESADWQGNVQRMVKKRKDKRKRRKRSADQHRLAQQINKQVTEKQRNRLHRQIDRWQRTEIDRQLQRKQKLIAGRRAPQVIGGVAKKKLEAKRYVALLESLVELRRVRRIQKGTPEIGEKYFNEQISKLKAIWTDALINYEQDERELRKHFVDNNEQNNEKRWMYLLFGTDRKQNGPIDGSEYNLEEFIRIRHLWDSCVVASDSPFGSSVPPGWVMPNAKPIEEWKRYQTK